MDPISATLLANTVGALASGAAGEAGKAAWVGLVAGVRRILGRGSASDQHVATVSDQPDDAAALAALASALETAAGQHEEFAQWLDQWMAQTRPLITNTTVTNTISGSATVHGTVIQIGQAGSINLNGPSQS